MEFYKYHGTGNDFILIDNRANTFLPSVEVIANLCHRRFGIGADGLILLDSSDKFDFAMRYYNADGKPGTMCGNGGRCIVAFANRLGIISENCIFSSIDGTHQAIVIEKTKETVQVSLQMKDVLQHKLIDGNIFLDTGSPHYILFSKEVSELDIYQEGRKLRNDDKFKPNGTNVNFVEILKDGIFVRTYERGVEDETLSCGTGVTASALAYAIKKGINEGDINIKTLGGILNVKFNRDENTFTNIWLKGPAKEVFRGKIEKMKL